MTTTTLPPQAQRRNLSQQAYENNLAASRRWKREHPEQAAKHHWSTCACGNRMSRKAERCADCTQAAQLAFRLNVLALRRAGLKNVEIGRRMGVNQGIVAKTLSRLKSEGVDVGMSPHYKAARS